MPKKRRPSVPPAVVTDPTVNNKNITAIADLPSVKDDKSVMGVKRVLEVDIPASVQRPVVNRRTSLLDYPAPWDKEWLEENNLRVVYSHGKAMLKFKQ